MPGLHAEGTGAGSVNCRRITECGKKKNQVGIIGISHIPFRLCLPDPVKIHIIQDLTHQFPSAAGNQDITFIRTQEVIQFLPALFRSIADSYSLPGVAVRPQLQLIS